MNAKLIIEIAFFGLAGASALFFLFTVVFAIFILWPRRR